MKGGRGQGGKTGEISCKIEQQAEKGGGLYLSKERGDEFNVNDVVDHCCRVSFSFHFHFHRNLSDFQVQQTTHTVPCLSLGM